MPQATQTKGQVPQWYPFALLSLGLPFLTPDSRIKGTFVLKGIRVWCFGFRVRGFLGALTAALASLTAPDPERGSKSRSLKGVPIKYPFVVRVPN